jgi:hypothetical protein
MAEPVQQRKRRKGEHFTPAERAKIKAGFLEGKSARKAAAVVRAFAPDFEALIEIETLAVMAGSLGRSSRRAVMAWVAANTATIKAEWNRINPRFPTK